MSEWIPIESAPKDGTRIILARIGATEAAPEFGIEYAPPHVWWCCSGAWSSKYRNWNDGVEPCGLASPSHWMPLPEPPQ